MSAAMIALAAGFVLLYLGGEALVRGAEALAMRLGMSPLLIGLTVVSFATSSPELVVSIGAAIDGHGEIAIGNVVGSNICNIGLILGLAVVIHPIRTQIQLLRFDVPILVVCSVATLALLADRSIGRGEGVCLLAGIVAYQGFCVWQAHRESEAASEEMAASLHRGLLPMTVDLLLIAFGVAALVFGGRLFVDGAVTLAAIAGVSKAVVGLTVVALGTSLPELATTLVATFKGHRDMAAGNVIGSGIFNVLAVLGAAAVVRPLAQGDVHSSDVFVMIGFAALLFPLMFSRLSLSRAEGGLMLAGYAAFVVWRATS